MNITTACRFLCSALLLFPTAFAATAQNTFTVAETDSIKALVHDSFEGRKDCLVIGLVDERGSQIFSGGKWTTARATK